MDKYPLLRKGLVCGIIVLFLGMSIISMAGSVPIDKEHSVMPKSCFIDFIINGTMGENGWYVSNVTVTIVDGNYTYFRIDDGNWTVYTGPFVISTDGKHIIGATPDFEHIYNVTIKIDQTPPDFAEFSIYKIGHNNYKIYANVTDATSGVNRVEFYLNDYLTYTDYEAPYEWFYKGPSFNPNSLVFDNAGNSAMPYLIPPDQITYFAIGFINNQQFNEHGGTFFAEFVIVIEHSFHTLSPHISTLTHQEFAFHVSNGYISENFMIVKAKSY